MCGGRWGWGNTEEFQEVPPLGGSSNRKDRGLRRQTIFCRYSDRDVATTNTTGVEFLRLSLESGHNSEPSVLGLESFTSERENLVSVLMTSITFLLHIW